MNNKFDVVIIGAGPSGACAGALLSKQGVSVCIIEKEVFPRFSIGESLLPHCMEFISEAGLLDDIKKQGFQYKDGAAFYKNGKKNSFNFTEKFSPGPGTTFQVQRGTFDKVLADGAQLQGVEIRYQHELQEFKQHESLVELNITDETGKTYQLNAGFVLDASGFGRVLPRLLDLEEPSDFPARKAIFSHVSGMNVQPGYDRNKILVTVHPEFNDIWYWLIPFSNDTASVGVVGKIEQLCCVSELELAAQLKYFIAQEPLLAKTLKDKEFCAPVRTINGYSANVKQLAGERFALLGNAGEFLDPVFSSGVTIALRSASMAVPLVIDFLNGKDVDWQSQYSDPLREGISTFKTFVSAWYDGRFQDVIFYEEPQKNVKEMISSILAGYAWDNGNPYVKESERRLNSLVQVCQND